MDGSRLLFYTLLKHRYNTGDPEPISCIGSYINYFIGFSKNHSFKKVIFLFYFISEFSSDLVFVKNDDILFLVMVRIFLISNIIQPIYRDILVWNWKTEISSKYHHFLMIFLNVFEIIYSHHNQSYDKHRIYILLFYRTNVKGWQPFNRTQKVFYRIRYQFVYIASLNWLLLFLIDLRISNKYASL